jgi:hypothetical protein
MMNRGTGAIVARFAITVLTASTDTIAEFVTAIGAKSPAFVAAAAGGRGWDFYPEISDTHTPTHPPHRLVNVLVLCTIV